MQSLTFDPEKHEYHKGGKRLPSVTEILRAVGLVGMEWVTEEALARGSAVHEAIRFFVEGDLDESSLHPTIAPYVAAFKRFMAESGFVAHEAEKHVSARTYAGTLDLLGEFSDGPAVIEVKTGTVPPWAALQVAAYADCLIAAHTKRFILNLKDNGRPKLIPCTESTDFGKWQACLAVYGLLRDYGRLPKEGA